MGGEYHLALRKDGLIIYSNTTNPDGEKISEVEKIDPMISLTYEK